MLRWASNRLYRVSNGWVALASLVVFVLFTALVLPRQAAEAPDAGSPDTSFWYSAGELYEMAEAYGKQGRAAYVQARFTFDLIWPLVYGAFLTAAMSWVYARASAPDSPWRLANLAPLLSVLLDYLENLSTSLVMLRYPSRTPVIDSLAPILTLVKWLFVGGSFALLLAGAMVGVWQRIRKRNKE